MMSIDLKAILKDPELVKQLKDAIGIQENAKPMNNGKNGFVSGEDFGTPKLSDEELVQISKALSDAARTKSLEEIDREVMLNYISQP